MKPVHNSVYCTFQLPYFLIAVEDSSLQKSCYSFHQTMNPFLFLILMIWKLKHPFFFRHVTFSIGQPLLYIKLFLICLIMLMCHFSTHRGIIKWTICVGLLCRENYVTILIPNVFLSFILSVLWFAKLFVTSVMPFLYSFPSPFYLAHPQSIELYTSDCLLPCLCCWPCLGSGDVCKGPIGCAPVGIRSNGTKAGI